MEEQVIEQKPNARRTDMCKT